MHDSRRGFFRALGSGGLALIALPLLALPALAQGYAEAVAVGGGEVFVGESLNERTPGFVYVYREGADGEWTEAAKLSGPDAFDGDHFGRALVARGDELLVGATTPDDGRGAVYVFRKRDGEWRFGQKLQPDDLQPEEYFGRAGIGEGDIALFATWAKDESRGAVYALHRGPDGTWSVEAKLQPEDADPEEWFGEAMAVSGDRALIGMPRENERQGAAYLYRRDPASGAWTEEAKLLPQNVEAGWSFGSTVGLRGTTAFVAAPGLGSGVGTVYTFELDEATSEWRPGLRLLPPGAPAEGSTGFGADILIDGDEILIGAPVVGGFEGRYFRFGRDGEDGWRLRGTLALSDAERGEFLGGVGAIAGDAMVAGLPNDDYGAGTAAILERSAGGWELTSRVWSEITGLDPITGGEVECAEGEIDIFGCSNVSLLSFVPVSDLGGPRGAETNDVWGWTDPQTGREYALVGLTDRATFVDVTEPTRPVVLGWLPRTEGSPGSTWRDIKVYEDHAFIVSDNAGEHGVQVFDLAKLREVSDPPVEFTADARYDRVHSAHNIVIDTESGYAYAVGSSAGGETCGGGLHMIDIREPTRPTFAGCFADANPDMDVRGYTHDAQCLVYEGPDEEHRGKQICFNSNERALSIADVTDKDAPVSLAMVTYPNVGYAHQGWVTDDQRYFFMDDEGDEFNNEFPGTRTLIWDIEDLDDPILAKEHFGTTFTSDHNLYVKGNLMYQSNYVSGLRILDISDPENPHEVGFLDTVPWSEEPVFDGSWSNYPFFESGTIVVTSGKEGLFMVKRSEPELVP